MKGIIITLILVSAGRNVTCLPQAGMGTNSNETEAMRFLQNYEIEASLVCNIVTEATWNYHTNITDFNKRVMLTRQLQGMKFRRRKWKEATQFRWRSFRSARIRRLFSVLTVLGTAALEPEERKEYAQLLQEMKADFSRARICPYRPSKKNFHLENLRVPAGAAVHVDDRRNNCRKALRLEPDLTRIMAESRNPSELRYVWTEWRNTAARPLREKFLRYVKLSNKAARLNGFNNTGEVWQYEYESDLLEEDLRGLWEQVRPLYEQLHSYVRRKLREQYGESHFRSDGTIPAHLLGNMWGQSWSNLLDLTAPYPGLPATNFTQTMKQQGYTALRIFRTAEDFFVSMGLSPMPREFYLKSMLRKPKDREVICHPTAWDFCNGKDYRIKQCTGITRNDLISAHHEMGHVHYAMAYRNQPLLFRDGANPGLHEAVGDAVGLSASTPSSLRRLGLMSEVIQSYENDINILFAIALEKVAFLPFGYLLEQWRWKVFRGEVPEEDLNRYWWELRIQHQGISPPVTRSERDFDPGSKYHIAANIPYIRYFVGHILQFQILDELCRASGHTGPLHLCDLYRSRAAGNKLRRMMELGKSQPWHIALAELTNGRTQKLDAGPLLRYFSNLTVWLAIQNRNEDIGWSSDATIGSQSRYVISLSKTTFIAYVTGFCALVVVILCLCLYWCRTADRKEFEDTSRRPPSPKNKNYQKPLRAAACN